MRRLLAAGAVIAVGVGMLIASAPAQAAEASGTITGLAGKCLDVAGANSADGTAVQIYDCNGTGAQNWTRSTDGTVKALGKCLDVSAGSVANGAKIPASQSSPYASYGATPASVAAARQRPGRIAAHASARGPPPDQPTVTKSSIPR